MQANKHSIKPGDVFLLERTFTEDDVRTFTKISGDDGEHHVTPDEKGRLMLQGLLTATLVTQFGGSIDFLAQEMTFRFHRPVFAGDTIRCTGRCTAAADEPGRKRYEFDFSLKNQLDKEVLSGSVRGMVLL
ncbi:MAG TPA: hotdog domain-containing protein [Myxococcales bacterium]|nr:hotdog domain-containing protein [Myxococcales bacterium]